jgi:hypothetical protein
LPLCCGAVVARVTIVRRRIAMNHAARFDAPFWLLLVSGIVFVGALGCLGLAAAAETASRADVSVLAVD